MQPTFYMLCLTCPCHHRNDQLSASWQDYLDTSYRLHKLYPIFGECVGSTSGHARNTGISPKAYIVPSLPVSAPSRIGPGTETGTLITVSAPHHRRFGPVNVDLYCIDM